MTAFVRFHEYNDHEGEQWNYWLPIDGNGDQLAKLGELLVKARDAQDFDLWYTLHVKDVEPEWVVDKLVEYAFTGYGDTNNKVTGVFTCPDDLGEDAELLYKGGIAAYFIEDD